MTDFLLKVFIKDYKNANNKIVREQYVLLASIVGLILNSILFLVKFLIGFLLNSISVMADSFNNLSDVITSAAIFVGFKISNKPPNVNHPFGYGRVEYILTFVISFFIMITGYEFLRISVSKIIEPEQLSFNLVFVFILLLSVTSKFWLSFLNIKLGKNINSTALIAIGTDCRNDCFITLATVASVIVSAFAGINIDGYIGLLVSLFVLKSGYEIAKGTLSPLLGQSIDLKVAKQIKYRLERYECILGTHDLVVHNYGPNKSMATIHVEVPDDMSVKKAHQVIDKAEREISDEFGITLVIHVDCVNVYDKRLQLIKKTINELISQIDKRLDAHEFRLKDKSQCVNIIFELSVPYSYKQEDIDDIEEKIINKVRQLDSKYCCSIEIEYGYIRNE